MILRANTTFHVGQRTVRDGDIVDSTDPIVAGREHLFDSPADVIETATASPGERRSTPPRKKAAAKQPASRPDPAS